MAASLFLVEGKVQGVFFRASTRSKALQLGLCGHAINLDDGRVEVLAIGGAENVDALFAWLQEGPPAAKVSSVHATELAEAGFSAVSDFSCD